MIQLSGETRSGWRVVSVSGRADSEAADALEAALRAAVEANARVAADFATPQVNDGLVALTQVGIDGRITRGKGDVQRV